MAVKAFRDAAADAFMQGAQTETAQRVGLALREMAKSVPISFCENILPSFSLKNTESALAFSFDSSITYNAGYEQTIIEKFPGDEEAKEYADSLRSFFENYTQLSQHIPFEGEARTHAESFGWAGTWGGHSNPDFGRLVNLGTEGIRKIIDEYKKKNTFDTDWFYKGCEYALDALDILGDRFYALAKGLAEEEIDSKRKQRLMRAAQAFELIPRKPANDFNSGVMAFWLLFLFDGVDSPGRFDQYMYRSYMADCDEEEKADLLDRLWEGMRARRAWNLCLAGSDENWADQANELTYDILRIAAEKKYNTPNITLRVHRNTPEKLWDAVADTLSSGIGMPVLYNDEIVCAAMQKIGITKAHSHEYCMNGCNQIDIMGKSHMGLEDGEVNLAKCLEYALNNGVDTKTNVKAGVSTGDARKFESFDQLYGAYKAQLQFGIYSVCSAANIAQHMRAMYGANPLRSCLIEGCLEKGVDYRNGGPLYGHGQVLAEGVADTGDSLWAVKKLVFDEKKYTMDQLMDALEADFEGYEKLRRDFASCEKFGCDHEGVDKLTTDVFNYFLTVLKRQHTYRGGVYTGGCSPFNRAAENGKKVGALPNGRKKGEAMFADSLGASPGCDTKGPTALIRSMLGYDQINAGSGDVFQVKFDKKLFVSENGRSAFKALAKTYFMGGGQQFTATVVSPEELLDAKKNPEKHRDLIVRVGGYSDYFVRLSPELQENVIERTMY
ncbi:MAG: hypothetical protein IJB92_08190 [Clostridia bacterium]|nr:hypothetical protein [Clostridia bacterium]